MNANGPYILVGSGGKFYFRDPEHFQYNIEHIAGALSRLCRFTGHTAEFYSVAQHSVFVSHSCSPEFALEGLLHDAPEAFISDLSSPLKSMLPEYRALEHPIAAAIYKHFGVDVPFGGKSPAVHHADMVALATEKRDLMPFDDEPWPCLEGIEPHPDQLVPLDPRDAAKVFLERYHELVNPTR